MATRNDVARRNERGLSILEALVIVTITAMLALILLPLVSRTAGRQYALSNVELENVETARAGETFRRIVSASEIVGEPSMRRISVQTSLPGALSCAREGRSVVTLNITPEGQLMCESASRRNVLLRWRNGRVGFDFSDDGRAWTSVWRSSHAPRYVRFLLIIDGGARAVWVAQPPAKAPEAGLSP